MNKFTDNSRISGQVLITGVIMLVVFLLLLLTIFDVHNIIRAKFKFETAQQSAALTGANWQRKSLNLIGELNILKACVTMLEGEKNWDIPLPPDTEEFREARSHAIQGRIDQLTEMQTRVSFIGPLIGYAAAQQAAKANGMRNIKKSYGSGDKALAAYLNTLYLRYNTGNVKPVNNYAWFAPYVSMLQKIADSGVAVLANARGTGRPTVTPRELGLTSFYDCIHKHKFEIDEIARRDERKFNDQSSWMDGTLNFVRNYHTWTDRVLGHTKYWDIDYTMAKFPEESEIFTLGVQTGFSENREWIYEPSFAKTLHDNTVPRYSDLLALPGDMKWFAYDDTWYPDYYASNFDGYQEEHYDYWFNGVILRKELKNKYRYEGPAAYTEASSVEIDRSVRFTPEKKFRKSKPAILRSRSESSVTVGTRRELKEYEYDSFSTSYRPGAIAKALGEIDEETPPTAIPLILPVFKQSVLMPTYMPIPQGFEVLRNYNSVIISFLVWLSSDDTESVFMYKYAPPANTESFLTALQILSDGKNFRRYGWNPSTTVDIQEEYAKNRNFLFTFIDNYKKYAYLPGKNPGGLGWLQEPKLCYEVQPGTKAGAITEVKDTLNGGTALRFYVSPNSYFVVNSKGKIITNPESDPTLNYTSYIPSSPGGGGASIIHSDYNAQKGPVRI